MSEKPYAIGIDLGNTQCNVAVVCNGKYQFLFDGKEKKMASCVAFEGSEMTTGNDVVDRAASATSATSASPSNTIFSIKRIIGKEPDDPEVRRLKEYMPYNITEHEEKTCVKVFYKEAVTYFTPTEITTFLLESLKKKAEDLTKEDVKDAVVSVPASFTNAQRVATKEAAQAAGLRVLALITEPTAAAIVYQGGRTRDKGERKTVAVVDMGGGKLDVSLISVSDESIDVRAVSGSTEVGGDYLTEILMDLVFAKYKEKFSVIPSRTPAVMASVRKVCTAAKQNLTIVDNLDLELDCFGGERKLKFNVSRSDYAAWTRDKVQPVLIGALDQVLATANLRKQDVSKVILVGGCTSMTAFRDWLEEYFGFSVGGRTVNPTNAVAEGAAMYAAILIGDRRVREMAVNDLFQNVTAVPPEEAPGGL